MDRDSRTLNELLEEDLEYTYKWGERYVFAYRDDERVFVIDPKTKKVEYTYFTGPGMSIQDEPDAIKITPEEVRRALS